MPNSDRYRDTKEAGKDTLKLIWRIWLWAGVAWVAVALLVRNVPHLNVIMTVGIFVGAVIATLIAVFGSVHVVWEENRARRRTLRHK
ncbi:hypothetical protein [Streptomyces niger]|uniref:hypothetical protein n=1 Tax=Streptomyces niger TaxID=66373 RepID=UPI00069B6B8D|nr:hypothetical protein [Streptomyces niger]